MFAAAVVAGCGSVWADGAPKLFWRGTASAPARVADNWVDEEGNPAVPTSEYAIVLDADSGNLIWDLADVQPRSWTQMEDYTGTVTLLVGTSRAEAGSLAQDGVSRELRVTGDVNLQGGTLTCGDNSGLTAKANPEAVISNEGNYRLWLRADGNVTVGANAKVDVSRCGFYYGIGPGYTTNGGGHGGSSLSISTSTLCYGNLFKPT